MNKYVYSLKFNFLLINKKYNREERYEKLILVYIRLEIRVWMGFVEKTTKVYAIFNMLSYRSDINKILWIFFSSL